MRTTAIAYLNMAADCVRRAQASKPGSLWRRYWMTMAQRFILNAYEVNA